MSVRINGKMIWWLVPIVQRTMMLREQQARLSSEEDKLFWDNDRLLYEDLLKELKSPDISQGIELHGRLVRWLAPSIYQHMQECEIYAHLFEEEANDWGNDYPLYRHMLDSILNESGMTMLDLEYEYGDLQSRKVVPDNPVVDDAEALSRMMAYWQSPEGEHVRNAQPAVLVQETGLNYDQIKRLLAERWKKAMAK